MPDFPLPRGTLASKRAADIAGETWKVAVFIACVSAHFAAAQHRLRQPAPRISGRQRQAMAHLDVSR